MNPIDQLKDVASSLAEFAARSTDEEYLKPIRALSDAADEAHKAWSGSWLGYHARVYYQRLSVPPPGHRFSQEWGLMERLTGRDTIGKWLEYDFDQVMDTLRNRAGNPDLSTIESETIKAAEVFDESRSRVLSVLSSETASEPSDKYLNDLHRQVEDLKIYDKRDFLKAYRPSGQQMSRDTVAIEKGFETPPHYMLLAEINAYTSPFHMCKDLVKAINKITSHMENIRDRKAREVRVGTNVFIGHGHSHVWKDLKDFIKDRLHLPYDEFNRVPVAGVTNIARLNEMLDQAAIAFLVMTAEDEQADGNFHARMNVVHEAGLFQGRLGFSRAIILLEEGCEPFSNIDGLGQIRFPKGDISAKYEEIRQVLEREGIIEEDTPG